MSCFPSTLPPDTTANIFTTTSSTEVSCSFYPPKYKSTATSVSTADSASISITILLAPSTPDPHAIPPVHSSPDNKNEDLLDWIRIPWLVNMVSYSGMGNARRNMLRFLPTLSLAQTYLNYIRSSEWSAIN